METRTQNKRIYLVRALLTIACIALLSFIFGNSLKAGEESSAQSAGFLRAVQKAVGFFAPNSFVATATGEAYEKLHAIVRTIAHFGEFALLGALCSWCYRAYTAEKAYFFVVVFFVLLVPIVDEFLQTLTIDRVADIYDVWVDSAGGAVGILFALCTLWIAKKIRRK